MGPVKSDPTVTKGPCVATLCSGPVLHVLNQIHRTICRRTFYLVTWPEWDWNVGPSDYVTGASFAFQPVPLTLTDARLDKMFLGFH